MKIIEKILIDSIVDEIKGQSVRKILEHLLETGLISYTACERHAIKKYVDNLVHEGEGRMRAIDTCAALFCCSFEKVRGIIYNQYK